MVVADVAAAFAPADDNDVISLLLGVTNILNPVTAWCIESFGCRWTTFIGAVGFGIALVTIALAKSLNMLILSTFIFGLFYGVLNNGMNNSALLTEAVAGVPILGSCWGWVLLRGLVSKLGKGTVKCFHCLLCSLHCRVLLSTSFCLQVQV